MKDYFRNKYSFITQFRGERINGLPPCTANLAICLKSAVNKNEVKYFKHFLSEQQDMIQGWDQSACIYLLKVLGDHVAMAERDRQQFVRDNQPMLAQDIEEEQVFRKQVFDDWISVVNQLHPGAAVSVEQHYQRLNEQPGSLEPEAPAASAASLSPPEQPSPVAGFQTHLPSAAAKGAGAQKKSTANRTAASQTPLRPRSTVAGPSSRVTALGSMFASYSASGQGAGGFSEERLSKLIVQDRAQYPGLDILYIVNVSEADYNTVFPESRLAMSLKKVGNELKSDVLYYTPTKAESLENKFKKYVALNVAGVKSNYHVVKYIYASEIPANSLTQGDSPEGAVKHEMMNQIEWLQENISTAVCAEQSGQFGPRRDFTALDSEQGSHAVCIAVYASHHEREGSPLGRLIEVIKLKEEAGIELQPDLLQLEAMNQGDYESMWKGGLSEYWQGVAQGFINGNQNPEERNVHSQQYEAQLQTQLDACIGSIEPPERPSSCRGQ